MNNVISTIEEIGFFETMQLIQPHLIDTIVSEQILMELPMCAEDDIQSRISDIVEKLENCPKQNLLFISPELALIERLAARNSQHHIIIALPCDLEPVVVERIQNNMPPGVNVSFLKEPFYPDNFLPSSSAIIAFGFENNSRAMLLPRFYRLMERYSSFMGRKIFIPCSENSVSRPFQWVELYKEVMFNDQF
ncbi:hypothetical protein [Fusibacter sp. 3D3]|uniref:hypothetical protein n=1 Tax=Fusibacter sp. 3D3 TaxID=1048380 RepID=UPI0008538B29|nr:hypothetical protein [Fusibacter sp. 3D3]GAU75615.1 hypothetical protein F3D3_0206 [Fusibacter sp. 3D3]